MDAIILAGGVPAPEDPLFALTQGRPKALLPMGRRTMLERVVDALQASPHVDHVVVVGLGDDQGQTFARPVQHLPDHGSMVQNGMAGLRWVRDHGTAAHTLLCSADIPLLTSAMVDDFVARARPDQFLFTYNIVPRAVMEARFPGSRRTFTRLRNVAFCGGDIHLVQVRLLETSTDFWEAVAQARKAPWRVARLVGIGTLVKLLLRRLTLAEAEAAATRILGGPCCAVINPHAELGMDVDKPEQVAMLRRELGGV